MGDTSSKNPYKLVGHPLHNKFKPVLRDGKIYLSRDTARSILGIPAGLDGGLDLCAMAVELFIPGFEIVAHEGELCQIQKKTK